MNELTPMKLNEDFFERPERFDVYEAEYNDFLFRMVFDNMCKLANLLYLSKTEMTCYETMLEDEYFNLFEQNIYAVRKLKRMSRQALDKLREIKIVDFLWEKNNEND